MITANQPAFPTDEVVYDSSFGLNVTLQKDGNGLSKREYFSAMAMQWILANNYLEPNDSTFKYAAACAVTCADYLITELNKQP